MTTKIRLRNADESMLVLLDGVSTVEGAVQRLASDPDRLAWLPIDLQRGDLVCVLGRVLTLPAAEISAAYQLHQRQAASREHHAHYRAVTRHDNAAALERAAPRVRRDDD